MKQTRFLALFLALGLLLAACGAAAPEMDSDNGFDYGYRADLEMPAETVAAGELKSETGNLSSPVQTDRKLIKTVEIRAETESYDALLSALEEKITALSGYIESRNSGRGRFNRSCSMTIRIPAEHLGQFLSHVSENANVLSTYENTQDVTLQYVDTEARIAALETEQTRLLELLAGANNLSEILEIEARLSDVTYELERYAAQKRTYDNQVSYATIRLSIEEVQTLTPVEEPTVWQRISTGFSESLEGVSEGIVDFFVWLIVSLPYLAIWVPVTALVLFLLRRLRSRRTARRQTPPPANNP